MSQSNSEQKYIDVVNHLNCNVVYYPKTNFTNITRQLSVIYSKEKINGWFFGYNRYDMATLTDSMIDNLVKNKLLKEPNRETRKALIKPWRNMSDSEKRLVLLFFNITPLNTTKWDWDYLYEYGYLIYLSNRDSDVQEYYDLKSKEFEEFSETKLIDYNFDSHKSFIEDILTNEQKIKLNAIRVLPDNFPIGNLSVSELNQLVKKYELLKNLDHLKTQTKIIIATNNSIEDIRKMVEIEKKMGEEQFNADTMRHM